MSRPETKNPFTNAKLVGADIDPEVYHRTGGGPRGSHEFIMSRGGLADFLACPSKWKCGYESKDTTATRWGSLMDTLLLSPSQMEKRFAVYPETYPCEPTPKDPRTSKPWSNNSTFAKEWKKANAGKSFIYSDKVGDDGEPDEDTTSTTLGNAQRAKCRLMGDARFKELIGCSKTQVMVLSEYHDRATGIVVPFKVLLDLVPDAAHADWGKCLGDFKTARDASERGFTAAMHAGFYDWQAAIYRDCYVAATGEDRTDFLFAVQENVPPYEPALWAIGCDWLEDARMEVKAALEFYCGCLATGEWPSYRISTPILTYGALSREAWMLRDIPRPPVLAREPAPKRKSTHELEVVP